MTKEDEARECVHGSLRRQCLICEAWAETEQLQVQLAGCLTAAEGHGIDEANRAKVGMYGWSLAYQKTLELRRERDVLAAQLTTRTAERDEQAARVAALIAAGNALAMEHWHHCDNCVDGDESQSESACPVVDAWDRTIRARAGSPPVGGVAHVAGGLAGSVQRCTRCGGILADYRNAAWLSTDPSPPGWQSGAIVIVDGNAMVLGDASDVAAWCSSGPSAPVAPGEVKP